MNYAIPDNIRPSRPRDDAPERRPDRRAPAQPPEPLPPNGALRQVCLMALEAGLRLNSPPSILAAWLFHHLHPDLEPAGQQRLCDELTRCFIWAASSPENRVKFGLWLAGGPEAEPDEAEPEEEPEHPLFPTKRHPEIVTDRPAPIIFGPSG